MSVAPRKPDSWKRGSTLYLMLGLLGLFVGLAFVGGLLLSMYLDVDHAVIPALMLVAAGLAMLATYGVIHKDEQKLLEKS